MGWKKLWDAVAGFIAGDAQRFVEDVGKKMDETLEKAEKKIEVITVKAIKASTVFLLIFVGLIFGLVGLANYLNEIWSLTNGVGLLLVGGFLFLLGMFAKLIR